MHSPWDAPDTVLGDAGVTLGASYQKSIVEHQAARERFLSTASQHLKAHQWLAVQVRTELKKGVAVGSVWGVPALLLWRFEV